MQRNLLTKINLLVLLAMLCVIATYGCGIYAIILLLESKIADFTAYIILAFIARYMGMYSLQGVRYYALIYNEAVCASQVSVSQPNSESPDTVQTVMKAELAKREEASKSTTYTDTEEKRSGDGE